MLELREVSRTVARETLLAGVSLSFTQGTTTALLGLSPAGRVGFLRLIAGVDRADAGTIQLDGREIAQVRRSPGQIAMVDAAGVKPSGRTVRKTLAEAGRGVSGGKAESAAGIADLVASCGLAGKLEAPVKTLDLDHRLRLAVAAARVARPRLLLINALSGTLPSEARERFIGDLAGMVAGDNVVVVATSSPEEAMGLGGRVIVLDRGRVLQDGPAAEVSAHPSSLAVALATSRPVINTLGLAMQHDRGRLRDGSTFQTPAGVALPHDGACTLAFRPEDVTLQRGGEGCVRFVTRAAGEETIAGRRYARLAFADAIWLAPHGGVTFPAGAIANAFVERSKLLVFDATGAAVARHA